MNKAYGLKEDAKELEPTENLDVLKNELFASRRVSKLCQDNHSGRLVRSLNAIKYWNPKSTEWDWQKAWYKLSRTQSQLRNNESISTLNILFQNRRYKPFVDLTLYTPIYVLMILLPLGVLIPGYSRQIRSKPQLKFSTIGRKNGIPDNTAFGNIFLCWLLPSKYANFPRLVFL